MALQPYHGGREHWADEMLRLDLLIEFRLQCRFELEGDNPLDPMRGLLITEDEVMRLLHRRNEQADGIGGLPPALAEMRTEIESLSERIAARLALCELHDRPTPLLRLAARFGLNEFERRCVVLALAPELDRKYDKLFGYLHDDVTSKQPTVDLALKLLCEGEPGRYEARAVFGTDRPLARWLLAPPAEDIPTTVLARPLKLDARIVSYLLEAEPFDSRLDGIVRHVDAGDPGAPPLLVGEPLQREMLRFARLRGDGEAEETDVRSALIHLWGPEGAGKRLQAIHLARALGRPLLIMRAAALDGDRRQASAQLGHLFREARLSGAIVAISGGDRFMLPEGELIAHRGQLEEWVRRSGGLLLWLSEERCHASELPLPEDAVLMQAEIALPSAEEQRMLWRTWSAASGHISATGGLAAGGRARSAVVGAAGGIAGVGAAEMATAGSANAGAAEVTAESGAGTVAPASAAADAGKAGRAVGTDVENMADKFRFTPGQIGRAVAEARLLADRGGAVFPEIGHYESGALAQIRHELEKKAKKLNPRYKWEDLILPEEPLDLIRQACNMMKYRREVYGEWGFGRKLSYGKGLSMLFAGPPGTGKTMAAEVAANDLRLEAYKIDLSQVISKYIGETEKNLHEIFREAQRTNAILFFDESDALFGKRSEVKDAHDKYANVETAYLLQKMEEYEGISILATNFQQNIDDAFMRRINIVVKFPFPDPDHREKLWRSMIPAATPQGDDIDFAALASRIEVAGGNIKNIVLTAAFMAASAGRRLGMRELVAAAAQELKKTGKILVHSEWEGFF